MPLDTKVRSEDLFLGLQPEEEFQDRMLETNLSLPEIVQTPDLEKIVRGFRRMEKFFRKFPYLVSKGDSRDYWAGHVRDNYFAACTFSPLKEISPEDITSFSVVSSSDKFNQKCLGFYLSVLINKSPEDKIRLYLTNSKKSIDYLLLKAREKNITMVGNTGNCCCALVNKCRIEIYGNTRKSFCDHANNSKIILTGNAGELVGADASKSEIHIFGNYRSLALNSQVEIYYNGILVLKDGKKIGGETK